MFFVISFLIWNDCLAENLFFRFVKFYVHIKYLERLPSLTPICFNNKIKQCWQMKETDNIRRTVLNRFGRRRSTTRWGSSSICLLRILAISKIDCLSKCRRKMMKYWGSSTRRLRLPSKQQIFHRGFRANVRGNIWLNGLKITTRNKIHLLDSASPDEFTRATVRQICTGLPRLLETTKNT